MALSVRMPVTGWIVKIRTKDLNQIQYPLMMSFETIILLTISVSVRMNKKYSTTLKSSE